jgi:hypothetical protein
MTCPPNTSLDNGRCSCGPGTYLDPLTASCQKCFFLCATCENYSTTSCLTCRSPGSIIPKCDCPSGYYTNNSTLLTNLCIACHLSCQTCKGSQATDCLTCKSGTTITPDGTCVCPLGKYRSQSAFDCLPCDPNCVECSMASNHCTVCRNNLPPPACTCSFPLSIYQAYSNQEFCSSCWGSDSSTCSFQASGLVAVTSCTLPFKLNNVSECACSNGYYKTGTACANCDPICATCFGQGYERCLTIPSSAYPLLLHPQLKRLYAQEGYEYSTLRSILRCMSSVNSSLQLSVNPVSSTKMCRGGRHFTDQHLRVQISARAGQREVILRTLPLDLRQLHSSFHR